MPCGTMAAGPRSRSTNRITVSRAYRFRKIRPLARRKAAVWRDRRIESLSDIQEAPYRRASAGSKGRMLRDMVTNGSNAPL
jgi:hypothetical protein